MQLHTLLQKIKQQQAVNFDQVIKYLPKGIIWNKVFRVEKYAKNKHLVSIIDHDAFNAMLLDSIEPQTRSQAASLTISSSHDVKCESAYMLCFAADNAAVSERLLCALAVSQKRLLPVSFRFAKQAILIENQDCFFQWQAFLPHFQSQIELPQSDIYFAGGKRVLNDDLSPILKQYSHIKCLFDYDLAGLQCALSLQKKAYQNVEYLIPDKIEAYASLFTFSPQNTASLATMLDLCFQHKLDALGHIIQVRKNFMEQEALI